jgi:hypothetical protein
MLAPAVALWSAERNQERSPPMIAARPRLCRFLFVLCALALVLWTDWRPVSAQTGDIALTADIVENFGASYSDVRAKADELSATYSVPEGDSATAGWQAWMGVGGAKAELDAAVAAHGFADFGGWLQAFSSIARAYAFAKDGGALDKDMAEALARIESDPNIPQAQKDMLLQQLQMSAGAISSMRPSQENIDAVAPHIDVLSVIFEDN